MRFFGLMVLMAGFLLTSSALYSYAASASGARDGHAKDEPGRKDPGPASARASESRVTVLELRNPDFEMPADPRRNCPPGWFCTVHADPFAFRFETVVNREGQHLRVTRLSPEPWAFGRQSVALSAPPGSHLRLSMMVNTEATTGQAGPKILLFGPTGVDGGASRLSDSKSGWQRLVVEVAVGPGIRRAEVGFLVEGGGVTLFDDARLEIRTPHAMPTQ